LFEVFIPWCRAVFGIPVFLCVFHVLEAWLVQLRQKLDEKKCFEEAFQKLHAIMYEDLEGTREEMILAV
jgi:hypothetical protein